LLFALGSPFWALCQSVPETQGAFRNPNPQPQQSATAGEASGGVPERISLSSALDLPANTFAEVMDRAIERERRFNQQVRQFRPIVETYLQTLRDDEIGPTPIGDRYFLGRLDLDGAIDELFRNRRNGGWHAALSKINI